MSGKSKQGRVLLLEDYPYLSFTLSQLLTARLALSVTPVENFDHVIAKLCHSHYDLLILDLEHVSQAGPNPLRHTDFNPAGLQILVLTNSIRKDFLVEIFPSQSIIYLPKPYDPMFMIETVASLLALTTS